MSCENFIKIDKTAEAGDHLKKRASIPLAPERHSIMWGLATLYPGTTEYEVSWHKINEVIQEKGNSRRSASQVRWPAHIATEKKQRY